MDLAIPSIVPHRLAVSTNFRGHGLAKLLMEQCEKLAIEKGMDRVRVDTNKKNVIVQSLLDGMGYSLMGEIKLDCKPPNLIFLCYEKILDGLI